MRAGLTCSEAQQRIPGYHGGWLSETEAAGLQDHLRGCAVCARDADRDAALCEALAALPRETPVMPTTPAWSATARPSLRRRTPPLALAAAVAAGVLFAVLSTHVSVSPPNAQPHTGPAAANAAVTGPGPWTDAHDIVSLSDASADPNRVMVLLYAGREPGARP